MHQMSGCVMPGVRQTPPHVHLSGDPVAPGQARLSELMQDNIAGLLDIHYSESLPGPLKSAVIGRLASALWIEECPVQNDLTTIGHIQDHGLEGLLKRMLVEQ